MVKSTSRRPQSVKKHGSKRAQPQGGGAAAARPTRPAAPSKASARAKWVYSFGDGKAEGKAQMRDLLGGKGAGLAEMANLGLPVPPGFTITTEVCTHYYANGNAYPQDLERQVEAGLAHIARITGKRFGDRDNPLLVSVRSGARASMPGMMDTVLNLGLNDETVEALAKKSGDRRFAYDSYRRFITHVFATWCSASTIIISRNCSTTTRTATATCSTPISTPTIGWSSPAATRSGSRRSRASRSRRTRTSSCGEPSARCSARG